MNTRKPVPTLIAGALLAACIGNATAQQPDATAQKQLAEAQKQLAEAARRVAELTREMKIDETGIRMARSMVHRPVIGVVLAPDESAGVRIGGVTPDGGAAKAGLKAGDRITRVDDSEILGNTAQLRIENAQRLLRGLEEGKPVRIGYERDGRSATASVKPQIDGRVIAFGPDGSISTPDGAAIILRDKDGAMRINGQRIEIPDMSGVAKQIETEMRRISPDGKGGFAIGPFAEAFRWNGLNLAEVDPQLGRYFGTDKGVLVVSAGEDLPGLQAGDVIRRIDGKEVNTPREAMAALRARPADSQVAVEFLRDRKNVSAQVRVPKATPFRIPAPPKPPVPPTPPEPHAPAAPPLPPAPPAPPVALI